MSTFPVTSATLIAKIKNLAPGEDSAAWVRFWNSYSSAIRQFAAMKGGEENADDIVMTVLGKLVEVLRSGQYTPEKGKFHSYLATMIVNEVHMSHRKEIARASDRKVSIDSSLGGGGSQTAEWGRGEKRPKSSILLPARPASESGSRVPGPGGGAAETRPALRCRGPDRL